MKQKIAPLLIFIGIVLMVLSPAITILTVILMCISLISVNIYIPIVFGILTIVSPAILYAGMNLETEK